MYALDFCYDGSYLSDYNFMICTFGGSSDFDFMSVGSKISFNKVPHHMGKINSLVSTKYDECLTASFDICKNTDLYEDLYISNDEYRQMVRWLNRREFLPFQLIDDIEDINFCTYNASFNVEKVLINRQLVGLRLTLETDKPFGYAPMRKLVWDIKEEDVKTKKTVTLIDTSDEIGYTYPTVKITCNKAGKLTITNDFIKNEDGDVCQTEIKNCVAGEVITMDGLTHIIKSNKSTHICNDFNYEFFRIGNNIKTNENKISVSLPCHLEISYNPIVKDSPQ